MKRDFSEPKIFTGGVDVSEWNRLSKAEQKMVLDKDWDIYYFCRNLETDKLVRQPNIKAGANTFSKKSERLAMLKVLQRNLAALLERVSVLI